MSIDSSCEGRIVSTQHASEKHRYQLRQRPGGRSREMQAVHETYVLINQSRYAFPPIVVWIAPNAFPQCSSCLGAGIGKFHSKMPRWKLFRMPHFGELPASSSPLAPPMTTWPCWRCSSRTWNSSRRWAKICLKAVGPINCGFRITSPNGATWQRQSQSNCRCQLSGRLHSWCHYHSPRWCRSIAARWIALQTNLRPMRALSLCMKWKKKYIYIYMAISV